MFRVGSALSLAACGLATLTPGQISVANLVRKSNDNATISMALFQLHDLQLSGVEHIARAGSTWHAPASFAGCTAGILLITLQALMPGDSCWHQPEHRTALQQMVSAPS